MASSSGVHLFDIESFALWLIARTRAQELQQEEEEVDDVQVQIDCGLDVVVGRHIVDNLRRIVEDVAGKEDSANQRVDQSSAGSKVEEHVQDAPKEEDAEDSEKATAEPREILLGDQHVCGERAEDNGGEQHCLKHDKPKSSLIVHGADHSDCVSLAQSKPAEQEEVRRVRALVAVESDEKANRQK
eukprot:CAMPEP_0183332056 /NCGR_PEP_ID=MMETSP0164_2-20130417/1307_1 /TAXON_ID=221442 /ORGANISM="Coccolithus pelagicus ssp braarudi, Strain PLY182g" /LENGTH=185 /DNA_ID=CAMNT_0025500693 /DNA_START=351 /DNA_END=908 /DNA_ORIENTATION=-